MTLKKSHLLVALLCAGELTSRFAFAQDLVVDGGTTDITSGTNSYSNTKVGETTSGNLLNVFGPDTVLTNSEQLLVGSGLFSGSNRMVISNGAEAVDSVGVVGDQAASSNNSVLVTGDGSAWINIDLLYVGNFGSGNILEVSDGGDVVSGQGFIGVDDGASNNRVTVTGTNSSWINSGDLFVGNEGSGNRLDVSNGASVSVASNSYIGFANTSSNNSVLVTGTNSNGDASTWTNLNLFVGNFGSSNRMVISNGGSVSGTAGRVGFETSSSNNSVLVTGDGSTWSNSGTVFVGDSGSGNSMVISNGGVVASQFGSIGDQLNSSNNRVLVTGTNSSGGASIWTNSSDLYVGYFGSGNSLEISNGGSVVAATGLIGFTNTASNNRVLVTGTNSTGASSFIIGSDLFVGGAGSGNRMEISGGGTVSVAGETVIGSDESSSNNTVTVSGASSSWTNSDRFTVGDFGSSNRLVISSGGRVDVGSFFFIGFETNSSNNSILVTGADSILTNSINLFVGVFGSSNSLEISDGGEVALGGNAFIGEQADSSNNLVTVTDSGSRLTAESLYVGSSGSGNRLAVSNGGQLHVVVVPGFSIGLSAIGEQNGSSNNSIWVTGAGSRWTNEGFLYVGSSGSGNSLVISNGGQVSSLTNSGIGFALNSSNNRVLVTGTNANGDFSTWTNTGDLGVGVSGSGNTLEIFDGGRVFAANMGVGVESDATSNSVVVAGSDSVLTNSGNLGVGVSGSGNTLEISNGGNVFAANMSVGVNSNADNNSVMVTGSNSLLSFGEGQIGQGGSSNTLTVSNGGKVTNAWTYIGFTNSSSNNSVVVTGDGSRWDGQVDFNIGYNGSSNTLVVSDGGAVAHGGHYRGATLGLDAASSNNSALVTGSNSSWTSRADFFVGYGGSGNSLVISNGGAVSNARLYYSGAYIGYQSNASNNSATVTGNNSRWTSSADFFVGYAGSGNTLTITNRGRVAVESASFVGFEQGSTGNTVVVAGSNSLWTNGAIVVGQEGSGNTLTISNGGNVAAAGSSFIGNGSNATGNIATVTGSGSGWTSGHNFYIGNQGSGNTLEIFDGGRVFAASIGVGVESNATGNSVVVEGTGSVLTNSGDFYVGNSGSGNSVVISNGGDVSVGASTIVGFAAASSNNALTVTGEGSSFSVTSGFSVGFNGSGNTLTVADGAELSTLISYVGESADAAGNTATVTGSGSRWTNTLELYVGGAGNSNSLNITDGASVFADGRVVVSYESNSSANSMLISGSNSSLRSAELVLGWYGGDSSVTASNRASVNLGSISVGYEASSGGNSLAVTGVGTSWTNTSSVSIGVFGANNTLTVSDGAAFAVLGPALTVGGAVSASNNSALVTGDGSSLTVSNNLIVGGASAGNRLTIEAGGEVAVGAAMTVGFNNNDGENIVSVTGPDSSLVVGSVLRLGWSGRSNSLVISDAASVTVGASIVANEAGSTGNSVVVTDNSRWTNSGDLGVGYKGSTNSLVISNGGGVASEDGYIGFFDTASGNTVVVTGDGSAWSNIGSLSVGVSGSGNTLTISNGASVHNVDGQIGGTFGATDNRVTVTGTNASGGRSTWSNSGFVTIGTGGSSSSLTINGGAALLSSNAIIGNDASNNSVAVTGTGSEWANQDALWVGYFGSSNSVTVNQGGFVSVGGDTVLGTTDTSSNNSVLVTDAGSRWTNTGALTVGYFGSGNSLLISDGGSVSVSSNSYIGFFTESSNNRVTVTDATWTNSGFLFVGASGSGNGLVISNGATVANTGGSIGNETSSTNNTVLVTDATWSNAGDLVVGQNGSGNSLVISNGGIVVSADGFLSYSNPSSNNSVTVTGAGSRWETVATSTNFADLFIGFSGSGNTLTISNQGGVYGDFGYVGFAASSSNNSVLVTGTDSVWTNSREIHVGFAGSGNTLTVSNGGLVTARFAYVGRGGDFNEAVVISNGRVAAEVVYVGETGMSNTFAVLSGGQVEAQAGYVGADANATGNLALISGPGAVWSNTFTFYVGDSGSGNNLVVSNRGQLVVGGTSYVGFNSASSNSAVVTGAGSVWTNGGDLYIGYNGNRNSLLIEDGGEVYNVNGYDDGLDPLDNSNEVTVTGTGSRWVNSGNLTFGLAGHGNRLNVYSNGLVTVGTNAILGDMATASNNTVFIAHSGARLEVGETVFVGKEGGGNLLLLQNGGTVTASNTIIGSSASSASNHVSIVGGISRLTNSGDLIVGQGGSANRLSVITQGVASANVAYVGYSNTSAGNSVFVSGPGAVWNNTSVFLGYHGASNSLDVSSGGQVVTTGSSSVGYAASSSNNSILVTGAGSVWTNSGTLVLGDAGSGNSLTVSDGGTVSAARIIIASQAGSGGTLDIGRSGTNDAAGTIAVPTISFGLGTGAVNFNQTNTFALTNTVTGVGSLNQLGSGTLFLGGDLSAFTGTVSAAVGTIVISNLLDLGGTTNMLLSSGGTFDVAQGGTNTLSLDMSVTNGTGTIVNSGGGTLVLATNISKSGTVLVLAGGEFVVNGVISGSGAPGSFNSDLVLGSTVTPGPATVTINTPATYVGPTIIRAGSTLINGTNNALPDSTVVTLGDAATDNGFTVNRYDMQAFDQTIGGLASVGPASNVVVGNGTLTVNGPSSTVFNGTLEGNMALVRAGTGATTLGGANTYSGRTTIQSGRLIAANASALGSGDVQLLGGTLELQSRLDIDLLFWDGGRGANQIAIPNPAAGHFVNVLTTLMLSNGIHNFNLAGASLSAPVRLLAAPGVTNNSITLFGVEGVDTNAGTVTLSYIGDELWLEYTLFPPPDPEPEEPEYPDFTQFAGNPNQMQVAKALNQWVESGVSGDRQTVLDAMTNSGDYQNAFNQMMPTMYESIGTTAFNLANVLNTSLFERLWLVRVNGQGFSSRGLAPAPLQGETGGGDDFIVKPDKNWGVFIDGYGVFANANGAQSMQNYNFQSGGVTGGASYKWNDNLATGVYVGYQGLQANYDNGSRLIDNAVRFGGFGTLLVDNFFFNAIVGGAYHNYQVDRNIAFGSIDRTASGDPSAGEFDFAIGGGYDFKVGNFVFGPTTSLQYTYLNVSGFTERGADSLNLQVDGYDTSSMLYSLGGQVAYNWKLSQEVIITPRLTAGWQHEFLQNSYPINAAFVTGGPVTPFSYQTTSPVRDYFYGGASVAVGIGDTWETAFFYNAIANQDLVSHSIYLSIGAKF